MTPEAHHLLAIFGTGVILTLVVGFYSLLTTRNLIRTLISLEILTKAMTLLLILAGNLAGQVALAQTLVITLIIVEVAVIVVAIGLILCLYQHNKSLDGNLLRNLKG